MERTLHVTHKHWERVISLEIPHMLTVARSVARGYNF